MVLSGIFLFSFLVFGSNVRFYFWDVRGFLLGFLIFFSVVLVWLVYSICPPILGLCLSFCRCSLCAFLVFSLWFFVLEFESRICLFFFCGSLLPPSSELALVVFLCFFFGASNSGVCWGSSIFFFWWGIWFSYSVVSLWSRLCACSLCLLRLI